MKTFEAFEVFFVVGFEIKAAGHFFKDDEVRSRHPLSLRRGEGAETGPLQMPLRTFTAAGKALLLPVLLTGKT